MIGAGQAEEAEVPRAVLAGNGRLYGGLVPMLPSARIDDGALT